MYHKSLFPNPPKVPESNIHHLLFNRPDQQEWTDYTLFVNVATNQRRSFREFVERVRDGATALGADIAQGGLGLSPENGEIVGILSENCLDYITLMHSLLVITVPFVPFSSYATPYEFNHANSLAQPTRIFTSPSLLPLALTSGLPADRIYLLEGESEGHTSYNQLVSSARKNDIQRVPVRHATKDTLAYMFFSSGTSGLPKVVMASHGNIACAIVVFMEYNKEISQVQASPVGNTPEGLQIDFLVVPLYHSLGLHRAILNPIRPSTIVMLPKWDIDVFLDSIPKYQIMTFVLVPSLIHQIVHHPRFKTSDLSSVKVIGCTAAYLPPQLSEQLLVGFPNVERVLGGYGLSEFTMTIALRPFPGMLNGRAKDKPGSVGILFPGVEVRIVRPDGSLAGPNEAGELFVHGAAVTLGYKGNDKATRETFVDGWVRTGDRMRIDEDGVLFFEDRAKDTLKVSGTQVSPTEIENILLAHPDKLIIDVSVAGVSGGRTSDERIPRAWVVLSSAGAALGEKEVTARLNAWVQQRLSRYKWLRGGVE
ncbi:acetyl-CoA synthetase-like protein, partial [Rhizopogon vinicolor AM-OR11-026]